MLLEHPSDQSAAVAAADTLVKKVALLVHPSMFQGRGKLEVELAVSRTMQSARRFGIEAELFERSEDIVGYAPDFVLSFSPQQPKLTRFPTYGLLESAPGDLLEVPRFHRNICTYDAYATTSVIVRRMLRDITFGARKLDAPVAFFGATVPMTDFAEPRLEDPAVMLRTTPWDRARFANAIHALRKVPRFDTFETSGEEGGFEPARNAFKGLHWQSTGDRCVNHFRAAGIGLCLETADEHAGLIPVKLLEIVATGAVAIAPRTKILYQAFGDSLCYFEPTLSPEDLARKVAQLREWILRNPEKATAGAYRAHSIFCKRFSLDSMWPNLVELHDFVLSHKGYRPSRDPVSERSLPSVTYIVRTGNRDRAMLERMLNSLVAQNYPSLTVLFVLWSPMPFLQDIERKYGERLRLRVIEDFGRMRSGGIITGMHAVDTDLFGMIDDDDELHLNHLRTMVKALRYHDQRDWRGPIGLVYSGSVEVGETQSRSEQEEWRDPLFKDLGERRAIEHFQFYDSAVMSQHYWFLMSNAWLAKRELIDEEVLDDPELDTCEDLYFFLQFAQKTHFAFSGEVTAVHHYHDAGNSTLVDAHRHIADTSRIALRNYGRQFPGDSLYDCIRMPIGNPDAIARWWRPTYEQLVTRERPIVDFGRYNTHVLKIRSLISKTSNGVGLQPQKADARQRNMFSSLLVAFARFAGEPATERRRLISRFRQFRAAIGWREALMRVVRYAMRDH